MKEERAARWTILILVIINWLICFGLTDRISGLVWMYIGVPWLNVLALAPAILLTNWGCGLKNPLLIKRMLPGLGLTTLTGLIMLQAMQSVTFNLLSESRWPRIVPPLIYLGLVIGTIVIPRMQREEKGPELAGGRSFILWLKYLIWANFLSLAVLSSWWLFAGCLALGALSLAAWKLSSDSPTLALGLATTQAAALAALVYCLNRFDWELALIFQSAFSVIGLLLAALAAIVTGAARKWGWPLGAVDGLWHCHKYWGHNLRLPIFSARQPAGGRLYQPIEDHSNGVGGVEGSAEFIPPLDNCQRRLA